MTTKDAKTETETETERGKVFLSYSRKDRAVAQRIAEALRTRHFGVFKDTDDILPTEEWKTRLEQLIAEADTIVFVLSPNSAASEVCAWEVAHAEALNKRIAPVVIDEVGAEVVPEALRRLNFIFCTAQDRFEDAADTLLSSLNTDIDWIREHTRLAAMASRWNDAGRPSRLCLRGRDISDAEAWRDRRPKEAPALTPQQAAFISASRKTAGRRVLWGGAIVAVAAIALGSLALVTWSQAQDIARRAALFSSDAARQSSARGDVAGALTLLLDAGRAFGDDAAPPHAFLIAADEVLQRAHAETRFSLPADAVVVDTEAFLLHSPLTKALYAIGPNGPEKIAELPPLVGLEATADGYAAIARDGNVYKTYLLSNDGPTWTLQDGVSISADAIGFEPFSAGFGPMGKIIFDRYSGDAVIYDPATASFTPRPYEPSGAPSETAHLAICVAGHPDADDLLVAMKDILAKADYFATSACRRAGEAVLFTMFETPNAGTIRHIYTSEGGGFGPPRTSTMLSSMEPEVRRRPEPGFTFGVTDVAEPYETRVEIRLGMMLETEPSITFTYPARIDAIRFLPDGRLAVLLEARPDTDERLAILTIGTEAPYRPRRTPTPMDGFADTFTATTPPESIAFVDDYEVVETFATDDPRNAVLVLHKGMSQVEAWMYSRETKEKWRKLARNHNRVGVTPLMGGAVRVKGQAGGFIFDGLHDMDAAMTALTNALPARCAVPDMRHSPCMPAQFRD